MSAEINSILAENEKKRLNLSLPLLFCYAIFGAWKDGVVYFSGQSMSIGGGTPLPVYLDSTAFVITFSYVFAIVLMSLIPQKSVLINRFLALTGLLTTLALFLPWRNPEVKLILLQIHFFSCVTMLCFENCIIAALFSIESVITHIFIAYPLAMLFVAYLQNGIFRPPFWVFHLFMVFSTVLLLFFFLKMPLFWPRYIKKSESLVYPKKIYAGIFAMMVFFCLLIHTGWIYTENIKYGVITYRIASLPIGFVFFLLWKKCNISPFRLGILLIGLSILGVLFALVSIPVPFFSLPACFLMSTGWTLLMFNIFFFSAFLFTQYPMRRTAPILIGIALVFIFFHFIMIKTTRENPYIFYTAVLTLALGVGVLYLALIPYLLFTNRDLYQTVLAKPPTEEKLSPETVKDIDYSLRQKSKDLNTVSYSNLSKREMEVAELMLKGFSYTEIGKKLGITPNTVISHRKSIYVKLGISSKWDLFNLTGKIQGRHRVT